MNGFETRFGRTLISSALCCALAAGLIPIASHAQTAAAPAGGEVASDESTAPIEQITVSVRKRRESVAEVPASITAFTAQTLEDYNIQSFTDYATKTPNISFSYGSGPTGIADARGCWTSAASRC
jgi:iron complex outermembrane recepter protein